MAPHNHPQVCVCVRVCVYVCLSPTSNRSACLAPGLACSQKNTHMHMHTQTSPVDKKKKNKNPWNWIVRPRKHISLTTGERADHTQMTQCVCDRGSHETATSVKVLFFIFILFLKPQYHPLTFHLNEHYPQQCLRAAGNISWPLAALMCHVPLDVWEVPIHPPQGSLHYRIDAAIYSLCTILLNNRCCCSDHFASYALIRSSSVFFSPPQSSFHKL